MDFELKTCIDFRVLFQTISDTDKAGMLEICSNSLEFLFVDVGSHVGIQCDEEKEKRLSIMCSKISKAVREYLNENG